MQSNIKSNLIFGFSSIKDLKLVTRETKGNVTKDIDTERYGETILESTTLLLVGAVILRLLGAFLDHGDVKKLVSWADPTNIDLLKYVILLGASLISVLAVNIVDEHSFVSCSKDQTVCLWNIDGNGSVKLVAKGGGHSSFVGAVGSSAKFIFSASKDGILKVNRPRNS